MSKKKPEDLKKSLDSGELLPAYLLHGEDSRGMDRALAAIEKLVLGEGLSEFNSDFFHGKETDISVMLAAASTLPMMADKRLVVVKRVEEIKGAGRQKLIEYLSDPVPRTVLAMTAGDLALRGSGTRKEDIDLVAAAAKAGMSVQFARPTGKYLPARIQDLARERGKQIDRAAVDLIADMAGSDLLGIEHEIEKIALYMADRKRITREDVLDAMADIKEVNVFEFTDAIGARDTEAALKSFRRMRKRGQEPLMILGMLLRHFRLIWKIQELTEKGETPGRIAKKTGLNEWVMKKTYLPQIEKFKPMDTGRITRLLADLDMKIKSSRAEKDILFERTVIKLCLGRLA